VTERFDVVVVGAGPAGLSAALNLVRARRTVLLLDSNRPRNSATFQAHGFLTRDGISPLELRRLGREEFEGYAEATFEKSSVSSIERDDEGFTVTHQGGTAHARRVLIATGLREVFPALPTLRAFYGTSIHSCMECDGYEYAGKPLALIGETDDLAERAILLTQWTTDITVFTNGVGSVSNPDEAALAARGIRVDRRPLADVAGDRDGLQGVQPVDGDLVPVAGAFVRPVYQPMLDYLAPLSVETDDEGLLIVDGSGRTSVAGLFAAGHATPPGPQQLIVAAGAGARVAAAVSRDLLG
jgi:thioredoxin reductase